MRVFALVTALGVAAGVALVGVSAAMSHRSPTAKPAVGISGAGSVRSLLAGIPQHGTVLGKPTAPVTLVEFADLQCPYCALWARGTLPQLVRRYVRAGKLRIDFRGLAFLGPDSRKALNVAQAAGLGSRLWNVVELLYENQGVENTGWVSDGLLRGVVESAGLEPAIVLRQASDPRVAHQVALAAQEARTLGVPGTPFFTIGRTGAAQSALQVQSLAPPEFVAAIQKALAA
jgi:protein-disulfide isomerase